MLLEYGFATFDSNRILIETYRDGVFYQSECVPMKSIEIERTSLEIDGYIYSEECSKKVRERIKKYESRM